MNFKARKFFITLAFLLIGFSCKWGYDYYIVSYKKLNHPLKIGVIELERLWEELPANLTLKKRLNESLNKYHKKFFEIEKNLKQENQFILEDQKKLNSNKGKQNLEVAKDLEKRKLIFHDKVHLTQKETEEHKKKVNQHYENAFKDLRDKVQEEIKKMAQSLNLDLILIQNQTVFFKPELNITTQIFERLKNFQPDLFIEE